MILETDRQTDIHVPPQPNNNINKLLQENNNISDLDGGWWGMVSYITMTMHSDNIQFEDLRFELR